MGGNHSGSVRFGSVRAFGKWEITDELLVVSLETAHLAQEQKRKLAQYCTSCLPIPIRLPGQWRAVSHTITGFDRGTHATTFYLAAAGSKRA
jgi:hypothetical protein